MTMADKRHEETLALLETLLKRAKALGASAADAVLSDSASTAVNRRLGKPEALTRSEEADIGLRVFIGQRAAIVSSSDRSSEALDQMAERAVAMAKSVPEDKYAGLADPAELAKTIPDLELFDATELSVSEMTEKADAAEDAARGVKGVTNSDGAACSAARDTVYYVASNGFKGGYSSSSFNISVSVIAGKDTNMETDYDYDSAAWLKDLKAPEKIGQSAGERAVRALNPRKGPTRRLPVVFDRRISGGLLGSLSGAISGTSVARGTTFLKDKLNERIFSAGLTVFDDPFLKKGLRSHPFDAEGISPQKRRIIDDGVLTGWLLDCASARQLGLKSTGNASRGASSPPSPKPANFYLENGKKTVEELLKGVEEGFFVTQLMGSGVNMVTGDYSRGARGFWIEKGKVTYAVSEMTIASNLKDMWKSLEAANDLEFKTGVDAPTVLIESMTVAGA
jgi:PmbA protein